MKLLRALVAVVAWGTLVSAQAVAPEQAAGAAVVRADDYAYRPDGRRDPFLSLVNSGNDSKAAVSGVRDGVPSFSLAEISVRGVMQSRDSLIAMIQGPDDKTYLIHQGDKLADAVVKHVTPQGLIVMQDISDPLSVQKQREVRKWLRSLEGAEK